MSSSACRLWRLAVLLLLVLLFVSACGTPSKPSVRSTPVKAGVHGTAMTGGGPVAANNTPSPWPSRNVIVLVHKADARGPVVARVKTDQAGRFAVDLAPGTYTLVQSAPAGAQPKTVTVPPGQYVEVTLWQSVP